MTNSKLQCRLCAEFKQSDEVIDVKNDEAVQLGLEHKIQQCFNLTFVDDVFLPRTVCLYCCEKVSSSYEFREQVSKAQEFLKPCFFEDENDETKSIIKSEFSDNDEAFDYVDNLIKEDLGEDNFDGDFVKDENDDGSSSSDDDSDYGKPLSAIKKSSKNGKHGKNNTQKTKRKSNQKGLPKAKKKDPSDPEKIKETSERSELIRRIKDEWKAYKWRCSICVEELDSLDDLRIHFEKIHNEAPRYTCMECPKEYESYYNFKRHVATHRNKFKYQCEICSRFFHRNKHYKNHLETHSPEKKFACNKCGKHYKTSNSLRGHLRTHIPIITPKYECDICHKKVNTKAGLLYHEKIHNGRKDFTCDQCGKTFLIHSTLKYHMRSVHSDIKPYCCELCKRTFKTPQLLKTHQQVHSDDRRHACEVCGRRFHRKGTLVRHSSVHTGVLAFACEYCYKRFRTKQLLKVHTRQHTGERPYSCLECNHHFTDSSNYIKHMRGKHGVASSRKHPSYKLAQPVPQPQQEEEKPILQPIVEEQPQIPQTLQVQETTQIIQIHDTSQVITLTADQLLHHQQLRPLINIPQ